MVYVRAYTRSKPTKRRATTKRKSEPPRKKKSKPDKSRGPKRSNFAAERFITGDADFGKGLYKGKSVRDGASAQIAADMRRMGL